MVQLTCNRAALPVVSMQAGLHSQRTCKYWDGIMANPEYGTKKDNGAYVGQCNCHICGALAGSKCWDMRYAYGTQRRATPHRERGDLGKDAAPAVAYTAKVNRSRISPLNRGTGRLDKITLATLRLMAEGLTYKQIAAKMDIKYSAVQQNTIDVLARMGATCAAHAVHLAYQRGILKVDDSQFPKCKNCHGPIMGREVHAKFCDESCKVYFHIRESNNRRAARGVKNEGTS